MGDHLGAVLLGDLDRGILHLSRLPPLLQMLYLRCVSVDLNLILKVFSGHYDFLPNQNRLMRSWQPVVSWLLGVLNTYAWKELWRQCLHIRKSLCTLPHVCERKHFIRECCSSFSVRQARWVSFHHLTQLVEHAFPFRIREFAGGKFNLLSNSNRIVSLRNNLEGCCWARAKPHGGPLEIKQRTSRESAKLVCCFQFTLLSSQTTGTPL